MLSLGILWFPIDVIIFILFSPIIFIKIVPFYTFRILVHFYVKIFYPNYISVPHISQMLAFDVFPNEPNERMVLGVGSVIKISGDISIHQLRSAARTRLFEAKSKDGKLLYPTLTASPVSVCGYLFFKPIKKPNYEEMVQEIHPRMQNISEFKYNYVSQRFPITSPHFSLGLYKSNGDSYIFMKFHHAVCDGLSMVHLLYKLIGEEPTKQRWVQLTEFQKLILKVVSWIRYPRLMAIQFYEVLKARNFISRTKFDNSKMRYGQIELNFEDVKMVAKKANVNLVSLANFLYGTVIRKTFEEKDLGEYMFTGLALPPLGPHPAENGIIGNFVSGACLKVPVKAEPPLDALMKSHAYFQDYVNNGFVTTIGYASCIWLSVIPHGLFKIFKLWLDEKVGLKLLSNVARVYLTKEPLEMFGHSISEMCVLTNISNYNNEFVFSLNALGSKCQLILLSSCDIFPTDQSLICVLEHARSQLEEVLSQLKTK